MNARKWARHISAIALYFVVVVVTRLAQNDLGPCVLFVAGVSKKRKKEEKKNMGHKDPVKI